MLDFLELTGAVLLSVALFGAWFWASYALADRLAGEAPAHVRICAAGAALYWLLIATFLLLASVSLFRLWVALPLWLAIAAAASIGRGGASALLARLRVDLGKGVAAVCGVESRLLRTLVYLGLAVVAIRVLRGLVAPPLAMDALTYHMLKAGRWVQTGGFASEAAPDAWGYYEYFSPYGDVIWAWAMLPTHSDAFVALAGGLVWALCFAGGYAAARTLGASARAALLAAALIAFSPVVASFVTSCYVENVTLALFLLGFVFLARALGETRAPDFLLASASFGVLTGVKLANAPVAAVCAAALAVAVWSYARRRSTRECALLVVGCAVLAAVAAPPYVRAWVEKGSPFYPIEVAVAGRTLFRGSPELTDLLRGEFLGPGSDTLRRLVISLVWPNFESLANAQQFLNFGPAAVVVLVAATVGAFRLVRSPGRRLAAATLLGASAAALAGVLGPNTLALRVLWGWLLGRLVSIAFAGGAVTAVFARERAVVLLLYASLASEILLAVPLGFGAVDRSTLPLAALWAALAVALPGFAWYLRSRGRLSVAAAVALTAASVLPATSLVALREQYRYRYYAESSQATVYDLHPIATSTERSWSVWRFLDGPEGVRIAATAGWDGIGHNWVRYPLLGSRLQNSVQYVPVTADGHVVDYRNMNAVVASSDRDAWLRRLAAERIDCVVLIPPVTDARSIEATWVRSMPALFDPLLDTPPNAASVYRFRADRLAIRSAEAP